MHENKSLLLSALSQSEKTNQLAPDFRLEFEASRRLIESAQRIVIFSHRGPDGDAVGANLGLKLAIIKHFKKDPAKILSACVDPPPESAHFLPMVKDYVRDFDLDGSESNHPHHLGGPIDLAISVDCGASYMVKFGEKKPTLFSGTPPFINIDHHATNDMFGTVNIVDPHAAAASQLVYKFLKYCNVEIDRHIATCILHGLYFDTGSFMHSNTSPEVLEIASKLMWRGADFKSIVKNQFHTMPVHQLKLFGKIFERARVNSKGITTSLLQAADFDEVGATNQDTNGAIDYLNAVPEGKLSCLLYEDRKGMIKGSLRTHSDTINLSKLAGIFGGGGHKKASGFALPGSIKTDSKEKIRIDKKA